MELTYALLASAAEFTPDGRLWILGGDVDTLYVPGVPVTHPFLTLAVKLTYLPAETEVDHRLRVLRTKPNGELQRVEAEITFTPHVRPQFPDREVGVGLTFVMQQMAFEELGQHALRIEADGQEIRALPLHVVEVSGPIPGLDVKHVGPEDAPAEQGGK